jgi:hypothetical protein
MSDSQIDTSAASEREVSQNDNFPQTRREFTCNNFLVLMLPFSRRKERLLARQIYK